MKGYRRFGVMIDMSRNAVMRVSELKNMIDLLQKMGYNALELYTEDTYEVTGEPYFGYLRGKYTVEELKEIDAYAKTRGVELIPCIQTLAHFTNLVKLPAYADIVDVDDILLIDEPKTYELLDKIFASLAESFTSRNVNIGMDEAHFVGLGAYLRKHGYTERVQLLLRHLQKVVEIATRYGFKPHMWADMFFRLASKNGDYYNVNEIDEEVKKLIPEEVTLVYWDYYSKKQEDYDRLIKVHQSFGREVWFAGGAWRWAGFAPHNEFSLYTMERAMRSVAEHGVKDVLITMWGDNGSECSFYSVLPSLYAIRQFADGNFDMAKIADGFYKTFKMKFEDWMLLDLPNKSASTTPSTTPKHSCKALLYNDLFLGIMDKSVQNEKPVPYATYAAELAKAAKRVGAYGYLFDTLSKLCDVLAIKTELGLRTRRFYQAHDKKALGAIVREYDALVKRLEAFHTAFRVQWNKESKPHGWEVQDARIGGVIQRTKTCALRLREYLKGRLPVLEELEEVILDYGSGMPHNQYTQLITTSNM